MTQIILKNREENGNYSIITLSENVLDSEQQAALFHYLETMEFYGGKTSFGDIPREQMWVHDGGGNFGDRANWTDLENPRWVARMYTPTLYSIQRDIQSWFTRGAVWCAGDGFRSDAIFDSILMNKYRGFGDSIKPHRDSEEIFGDNPSVVILSIGCPREIIFNRIIYDKKNPNSMKSNNTFEGVRTFRILMPSGSVLVMGGEVQKYYSHEIKKVKDHDRLVSSGGFGGDIRYSLTFRQYENVG
jgi:alkylated DNA repair dioxygenase AlkB